MKRIFIADSDHDELVITKSVLSSVNEFEIAGDTTSYSLLPSLIERHRPQFVMIAMRCQTHEILGAIQSIRAVSHPCQIIVLGDQPEAGDILQCFRAGADEFICTPLDVDELLNVIKSLEQKHVPQSPLSIESKGTITAVCGCRGGSGTTTIAVNLAEELSHQGSTVLIDFHFGQGDLGMYLNITPKVTLSDIQQTHEPLDEALLESAVHKYSDRFHLLLQSIDGLTPVWDKNDIQKLLQILCQQYEHVIVDTGTNINILEHIKDQKKRCVLVMKQDMASLSLAKVKHEYLKQIEHDDLQIMLLVNAYTKKSVITLSRISKVLHSIELETIREDEKSTLNALNRGIPLREVSSWSRALRDIRKTAERITGKPSSIPAKPEESTQDEIELKPLAAYQPSTEFAI